MSALTPEQQLDVIWWALGSVRFWVSTNVDGSLVLQENITSDKRGRVLHQFKGTRAEICEQLIALQVADRIDGVSHDLIPPAAPYDPDGRRFNLS